MTNTGAGAPPSATTILEPGFVPWHEIMVLECVGCIDALGEDGQSVFRIKDDGLAVFDEATQTFAQLTPAGRCLVRRLEFRPPPAVEDDDWRRGEYWYSGERRLAKHRRAYQRELVGSVSRRLRPRTTQKTRTEAAEHPPARPTEPMGRVALPRLRRERDARRYDSECDARRVAIERREARRLKYELSD